MRYWVAGLTSVLFLIWLLPLGIFINPSREKVACGGQRAICMCIAVTPKKAAGTPQGSSAVKAASSGEHEKTSSSGNGGVYLPVVQGGAAAEADTALSRQRNALLASGPFLSAIEHVPKS